MSFKQTWWPQSNQIEFDLWEKNKKNFSCELDEIAQKYNCDKSNSQIVSQRYRNGDNIDDIIIPGHNYTEIYESFFKEIKNDEINILELGIGNYPTNGYSLRLWLDYFPNAKITLLDWSTNNFTFDFDYDKSRVEFHQIDQNDENSLIYFSKNHEKKYDVIIDDCSHQGPHQFNTLKHFFPNILKPNGIYFIEDIHETSFLEYLPYIYDNLNGGNVHYQKKFDSEDMGISEIRLYRSLIYFKKGLKITR